jgi:SAM-dependent methyltransferase
MRAMRSLDFQNKKVLDIGCRDGLFSFEAEKLGAAEIIAIDNSLSPGAIEVLIPYLKSKVQMHEVNIIDLSPEHFGLFDIVIFPGTLYHLRYPFWALKVARDCLQPGGSLIIETAIFRDHNKHAMLHCPIGYESPYEPSSCSFFNLKGLKDTLFSLGFEVQAVEILKDGLQNKQSNPHELVKELLKRGRAIARLAPLKVIDRATVVCRKSDRWDSLDNYWHGTHTTGEWK